MANRKRTTKNYAMIYCRDKEPIKKAYDTASAAYYDYLDKDLLFVKLFDARGILICTIEK